MRPSALLKVISQADQGLNQAITNLESGTPVETALLDVLEVCDGETKITFLYHSLQLSQHMFQLRFTVEYGVSQA